MIDTLGTAAAMRLRWSIESAISSLEDDIKQKPLADIRKAASEYFDKQHEEKMTAIAELRLVLREVYGRVFISIPLDAKGLP